MFNAQNAHFQLVIQKFLNGKTKAGFGDVAASHKEADILRRMRDRESERVVVFEVTAAFPD